MNKKIEQINPIHLPEWWSREEKKLINNLPIIVKKSFSIEESQKILKAIDLAFQLHKKEKRAGGEPYIVHPFRIAISLILEFSITQPEIIIAGLLHDILENTNYNPLELKKKFGNNIHKIVNTLTRKRSRPKTGDRLSDAYYQNIIKCGNDCLIIKLADKLDNLRDALNHPNVIKRKLYVKESYEVFLPLMQSLGDKSLYQKIKVLFEEAMENHDFYKRYLPEKYFLNIITQDFNSLKLGEYISYEELSKKIPDIDKYLNTFLLFNPELKYWLNNDSVQIVKTSQDSISIIYNVCNKIIKLIEQKQFAVLGEVASIPYEFTELIKYNLWEEVVKQLNAIIDIIKLNPSPDWLEPILKDPKWILLVIHSRLFIPANLNSSLWQTKSVIGLKDKDVYKEIFGEETIAKKYGFILYFLLSYREALLRYQSGYGSTKRANYVLKTLKKCSSFTKSPDKLLSIRLLSEYLYFNTSQNKNINLFNDLWREIKNKNLAKVKSKSGRESILLGDIISKNSPASIDNLDIIGFDIIKSFCEKKLDNFYNLIKILLTKITENTTQEILWIFFDVLEIIKRKDFFIESIKKINNDTKNEDLNKIGIEIQEITFEKNIIFIISPSKWFALQNRLPEITEEELKEIEAKKFSAEAIFDTLLRNKLNTSDAPIWMPRIYRVLDTMVDFDPFNVQCITLFFESNEKIEDIKIYLPLSENSDIKEQEIRKEILSRFIVTTIFNYAVTLGIYSAYADCSPIEKDREELGLNNLELEAKLISHAKNHGYSEMYGSYVQNFNFKSFSIKSATKLIESVPFTKEDMVNGIFLGIDIGGTDTKICLFNLSEKIDKYSLETIKTFSAGIKSIKADEFCNRIIYTITSYLKNYKILWKNINGVGISWPGAVRNSKVVGISGTLKKIEMSNGKMLNDKSLPQEIQSIDLNNVFYKQLQSKKFNLSKSFVTIIENDGNAEAYGNFCMLEVEQKHKSGGKIVIKLGTSLAGGHIDSYGAISSNQVTEFSKIILDFNVNPYPNKIEGCAREFVSSKGIRNLSRNFIFNNKLLFGDISGKNESDDLKTRVESIELGELLKFWKCVDDDIKNNILEDNRFLLELINNDNKKGDTRFNELFNKLNDLFLKNNEILNEYIFDRGCEQYAIELKKSKKEIKDMLNNKKISKKVWNLGINRLNLLCTGKELINSYDIEKLPEDFDFEILSEKILGTIALFSQLGLQIAQLIVLLYNIYRKKRFKEIILAGGVLSGLSGVLVKVQIESFLLKYYDKVYGKDKNLELDSIGIAQTDKPAIIGPLGAAMIANRVHKMSELSNMQKIMDFKINNLKPGETILFTNIWDLVKNFRIEKKDVINYFDKFVSESILIPKQDDHNTYIKTLLS
ncbi:MAG: HD domain-containing protein [Candidatus Firestonebacteria bacterium]|nr:HD domain-containing protein [Candidatus Firestonebacteria bacterium]